jgi:DNA-binding XRE family transcriptional regulator
MPNRNTVVLATLRQWRARALLTQAQLADKAGVNLWTVTRAEAGQAVNVLTAERLARALDVSSKDLISKEPN